MYFFSSLVLFCFCSLGKDLPEPLGHTLNAWSVGDTVPGFGDPKIIKAQCCH